MMRLCREDKPGSAPGSGRYKLFLLLILLPSNILPQIPVNGFCRYTSLKTDSGYTSVFQLNYNNDSYSDLILYNPGRKDVLVLKGGTNGTFTDPQKYSLSDPVSHIENIINSDNIITGYFFTSRKSLKAGFMRFNDRGRPSLRNEIKLNSYPEFISVNDIDNDGTPDYMVSGSAFKGLTLLNEKNGTLKEKQAASTGTYSRAVFSDVSNDGYTDIAAHNIITNTIDIFYNNAGGSFYKVRSFPFEDKIESFRMYDIDFDGYEDIIISQRHSIKVYFGDFASSYKEFTDIKTDYNADMFLAADYNKDGLIDFAYMDKQEGIVSILYSAGSRSFHKEMIYIRKAKLEKIIPYYSRFINGIIALSSSGYIYSITNLTAVADYVNVTGGGEPGVIRDFDFTNNGITDYAFVDLFDLKLKIFIRNNDGIPASYYAYPLFRSCSDFLIRAVSEKVIRFYCYSKGEKLIEIIEADFDKGSFRRNSLYSPGTILDLKTGEKEGELLIIFLSQGSLGFSKVEQVEQKYIFSTTLGISDGIADAWFAEEKSRNIYYWSARRNLYRLEKFSYKGILDDIVFLGSADVGYNCPVRGITGNLLNNSEDYTISFLKCGNKEFTISSADSLFLTFNNNPVGETGITDRESFFYGEIRFGGLKKLAFYNPAFEKLYTLNFLNEGREIISTELAEAPGVRSYFIKNMNFRSYHLVYSNSNENCITIMQL